MHKVGLCWIISNDERGGFSLSLGLVCKWVSARNVGSSLYLGLKKGFVVAAISKVIYTRSSLVRSL